jgi:hypothetical protein
MTGTWVSPCATHVPGIDEGWATGAICGTFEDVHLHALRVAIASTP